MHDYIYEWAKPRKRRAAVLTGQEWVEFDFRNPRRALAVLLQYRHRLKTVKEAQQRAALLALSTLVLFAFRSRDRKEIAYGSCDGTTPQGRAATPR
jgi:hypothetical protein